MQAQSCNQDWKRFIPPDVKPRSPMLVLALLCATAQAQTPNAPATAQTGSARPVQGSGGGAAPTRANGQPPTEPGLNRANATSSPSNGGSGGNSGSKLPPAPAATGRIEIIGRSTKTPTGTVDRPLLPIAAVPNAFGIRSGTPILVTLSKAVDSGHARNGDMLTGKLAKPIGSLPAGTPVQLTVVASAPAGQLSSYGALSVQVVSINGRSVLSDTVTALGKPGAKELPDAAPARGTEAVFPPDQPISLPAS